MKRFFIFILIVKNLTQSLTAYGSDVAESDLFRIRLELSPVWQSFNRVQIPSPGGTLFDFTNLGTGPVFGFRIDGAWRVGENSELRALYAPLSLRLTGQLSSDVSFQNSNFLQSSPTTGLFQFNSYRLTYRHRFINHDQFTFWAGLTGNVRDAQIALTQGTTSASRSNVGFVPLLHVFTHYRFTEGLRILLEVDALAAPQGRAEDIGLLVALRLHPQVEGFAGYRTLEGGSDGGGNVYNFTWLHYAVIGAGVSF